MFTSGTKEVVMTSLHTRIPLNYVQRNVWLNLSIDLANFCSFCFKGSVYRSTESIVVSSHCRIRKIFTMRGPILDVSDEQDSNPGTQFEVLPKSVEFPMGITFSNQVFSSEKIGIDNSGDEPLAVCPTQMLVEGTKVAKTVQLAFGTRTSKLSGKPEDLDIKKGKTDESNTNTSSLHETINEPFKTQHVMTTTTSSNENKKLTSTNLKKKTTRNMQKDQISTIDKRSSDVKLTCSTIEFQAPTEDYKGSMIVKERDVSEPHN